MGQSTGRISDHITWMFFTNQGVVVNNNGTIQKTYTFTGKDQVNMSEVEREQYLYQINNALKRLKTGYQLYFEAQKRSDTEYMDISTENELTNELDVVRKERLVGNDNYIIRYYLTIVYRQPSATLERFGNMLDKNNKELKTEIKHILKDVVNMFNPKVSEKDLEINADRYRENLDKMEAHFLDETQNLISLFEQEFLDIRPLTNQETLTYLHSTISDRWYDVKSNIRAFVAQQLCDATFLTGREPKLGDHYIGILGIKDLPQEVQAFVFDLLNSFKSRYRFCTRYLALTKEDAKSEMTKIQAFRKQGAKSFGTMILEAINNKKIDKYDESALLDSEEVKQALVELQQDEFGAGYITIDIVLLNTDKQVLKEELQTLRSLVDGKGFVSTIEKDNAPEAWLSTIPSCYEYNVRSYFNHSITLAACLPISAMWEGQKKNEHFAKLAEDGLTDDVTGNKIDLSGLQSMPLMKCTTPENLPFYFNLHFGEVGHTFIAGATGTGKSVLLNAIACNFQKYKNAQVYIFDKSASSRVLTKAIGGNFYNMLVDTQSVAFQPLARIDDPTEQIWVHGWLSRYAASKNATLTPQDERDLTDGLKTIANQPLDNRTLTVLSATIQNEKWRLILSDLLTKNHSGNTGLYGHLFDSTVDKFGEGRWQVFEMEKIMANEAIVSPTLDYLFHRIESSLTGYPTLIILDECWLFLRNEAFRKKIVEYLKDLRKKNASVIMATQNLSDITDDILPIIVENMSTKILLANYTMNEMSRQMYIKFGLNDEEISTVKKLKPKQEYFFKSLLGARVFGLDLKRSPVEMAFLTATSKIDQQKAEALSDLPPHEFIESWKRFKLGRIISN